ncbi:dihydrofolate reductase family protein [Tomitella biformata]|uniref:dihydrofolate reductase family protein n=1 Tax=Tomitella biformata TaxID=630403 RepID=UPI0004643FBF|nr:dihydrofolate reductase family protein [Tomitella biformata]
MRELTYFVAVSLDGYIAAPGHDFADFPTAGDHIDVITRDYTDTINAPAQQALGLRSDQSRFDTVLMGWNTYGVGLPYGVDSPYPHLRQYVFSRRQRAAPDGVTVTAESPAEVARTLKAEDAGSGIWLCGGGQIASALIGQIDRLILKVNPILLGGGVPLFADRGHDLRQATMLASTAFRSGVIFNEYQLEPAS